MVHSFCCEQCVVTLQNQLPPRPLSLSPIDDHGQIGNEAALDYLQIPTDGTDVWEIDVRRLNFENKVASGSYCDL